METKKFLLAIRLVAILLAGGGLCAILNSHLLVGLGKALDFCLGELLLNR